MAPLLRRSWALKGQPPQQHQRVGHREKVSVAAALWLTPRRDELHLAYQTLVNGYYSNIEVADFLQAAADGLPAPAVIIWDGGTMHKGGPIREVVQEAHGWLEIEPLPANAPELMPTEQLWSWLKYSRLCNYAPRNAAELNERVVHELDAIRERSHLLASFFHLSDLPLPRALLS